ncbi:hypothetical protein D1B33_12185 [Lysinibacillus yapensis]|uniref:HEAT repeat domain-containing protein n=1 Tax=Ureibacillus yapensis TaxID=2304605 RepID=A0A396SDH1_9BACL|nr:hypothetical protein [Lysinibacillus yapensis]RHW35854.1 hypothetical protein D1B33_12185 [Lysinibacillus yapensis]
MSVLNKLSTTLHRKDSRPNMILARELVENTNIEGIQEIIENLRNKDKKVSSDCLKVAYEIGRLKPELISDYAQIFIDLLKSSNNRMVWGAMQVLSTLALVSSQTLLKNLPVLQSAIKRGSVITVDKGILTLAKLASISEETNNLIFPYLLEHLRTCRTREVPQHAESTMLAVTEKNRVEFLEAISQREPYMTKPQARRIKRIIAQIEKQQTHYTPTILKIR